MSFVLSYIRPLYAVLGLLEKVLRHNGKFRTFSQGHVIVARTVRKLYVRGSWEYTLECLEGTRRQGQSKAYLLGLEEKRTKKLLVLNREGRRIKTALDTGHCGSPRRLMLR